MTYAAPTLATAAWSRAIKRALRVEWRRNPAGVPRCEESAQVLSSFKHSHLILTLRASGVKPFADGMGRDALLLLALLARDARRS